MFEKKQKVPFIRHYSGTYAYHARVRRNKIIKNVARVLFVILVFLLGYFLMRTLLGVSSLPPV